MTSFRDSFFEGLSQKRGGPGVGGMPINLIELTGSKKVHLSNTEIDPVTSKTEYYYNTRLNILFKRIFSGKKYAIWRPVNVV